MGNVLVENGVVVLKNCTTHTLNHRLKKAGFQPKPPKAPLPYTEGELTFAIKVETTKPVADDVKEIDPIASGDVYIQQWEAREFTPNEKYDDEMVKYLQARSAITAQRDTDLDDPNSEVEANGFTFQTGPRNVKDLNDTITHFSGAASLGITDSNTLWRDVDNVSHVADLAFLMAISTAKATLNESIWQKSFVDKDAIPVPVKPEGYDDEA